jgi:hypothetical protein
MDGNRRAAALGWNGVYAEEDVMNEWNNDMLDRVGACLLLIGIYLLVRFFL